MWRKISPIILSFWLALSLFLPAAPARAAGASLFISPSSGTKAVGSTFSVNIKVNSGGNVINAAEGVISYDGNILETVNTSKAGSIFPFWTTEPSAAGGSIRFGGGLPPPAFNGSSGHIISVTFRAKKAGTAQLSFVSGAVLANDGKGTNIISGLGGASFTISGGQEEPSAPAAPSEPDRPAEPERPRETAYNLPAVESPTHPDQDMWYPEKEVKFSWFLPDSVSGVSASFNQEPYGDPGSYSDGKFGERSFQAEEDGVYYLHVKFYDGRRWGTVAHFRVNIDSAPPDPFEPEISQAPAGKWPSLKFAAVDGLSGIGKYLVYIDSLEHQAHEAGPEENTIELKDLEVGGHMALVKALDKAGNERLATVKFNILPIESPEIINYPEEMGAGDNFYAGGTAAAGEQVEVYISLDSKLAAHGTASIDESGKWLYLHPDKLDNGRYVFWAEAVNEEGIKSRPSEKKTFLVSPPVFAVIGDWVIDYFMVFAGLLLAVVLIVLAALWLAAFIRRKLKKEAYEIEEIMQRMTVEMKDSIETEFSRLPRLKNKAEQNQLKERLLQKADESEEKVMKEIKDVEKILK